MTINSCEIEILDTVLEELDAQVELAVAFVELSWEEYARWAFIPNSTSAETWLCPERIAVVDSLGARYLAAVKDLNDAKQLRAWAQAARY